MKKSCNIISRAAFGLVAAGALSLSSSLFAQEDASPGKTPAPDASAAPGASPPGSMAPVGQKPRVSKDKSKPAASPANGNAPGGKTDQQFLMKAAKGGMMEVHMGQMAEKQGQSADVKKIGARMVADHTKVNNELMALAQTKGVKLDTRHKMDKMDSANFDQMYLDQMVKDHEKDIAEFETEAKSGMDPEVKRFASKNLPTLKKHLEMVKSAQGKMKKG